MSPKARVALIVGAGFAGAVLARALADAGYRVQVIDRRDHIGGNAADFVDNNGIRVHRYGPHLFHTGSDLIFNWLRRFGEWVPYQHRARAVLPDGRLVPLPINLDTINAVFGGRLENAAQAADLLHRVALPIARPANAAEHLYSQIGQVLTDLFFRPYTQKMWGLPLEDLDASVVRRLPVRLDRNDLYFPEARHQALPRDGYTALFQSVLAHANISVELSAAFVAGMEHDYVHCFNSMAIDEFFDYVLGRLPYRSLRFEHRTVQRCATTHPENQPSWSVLNYTDAGRFTREAWWHRLPGHLKTETGRRTVTVEEPCDDRDNREERYYPVKTADRRYQALYSDYRSMASALPNMTFVGRCGTYRYLDMDQVIGQSLARAQQWLASQA